MQFLLTIVTLGGGLQITIIVVFCALFITKYDYNDETIHKMCLESVNLRCIMIS